MADEQAPEIQINVKGPSELKLQIAITTDKTVLELKQAIAAKADVAADRQRLIYSGTSPSGIAGAALTDDDALSVYKIQSTHTIHMVKGVSRTPGGGSGSAAGGVAAPQQLPAMQTGQNVHDPLTQLNGHQGFGAMAGLNPFGDMGINPNDPNMMQGMLNSPQFLQQMSAMMSNPAIIDQVIASSPQLASMGPQVRQAFQDEGFRQMISNPESLQQMLRMASAMQGLGGASPFGGAPFGAPQAPAFPAPGTPTTAAGQAAATTPSTAPGSPQVNPFALFNPAVGAGAPGAVGAGAAGAGAGAGMGAQPFGGLDPAMMQQMLGMGGPFGGGAGAGGLGAYGGFGPFGGAATPAAPADTRSPEERFQVQLQQLQDMGFTNAAQNVRALLATGGNVQGAIDYIFGGGGL
ncbi:hypothetical protein HYPSUDRAFT_147883 [Hypholoma sublateritium FD-334 SS-4]|uniref:UBA domain-containing protein n=1 Tax=Hypholoma sublateritium (strain FD-334 SS-4) TaxID=945553 RepID=A0A0D2LZI1_HYPSF|nr:hypothetical protein HYPSUDRAFT_147883 [Hypholoma sublateritium FD-334 SS-4]